MVPHDLVFNSGLANEAILGICTEPFETGVKITDANFRPNKAFVELLHSVIATYAPQLPELQAEARRQATGWLYIIDRRTPTPLGDVPPHDIFGALEVRDGFIVPQSYQPNTRHRLFSSDGLFQLGSPLHERLMERIMKATDPHQPE